MHLSRRRCCTHAHGHTVRLTQTVRREERVARDAPRRAAQRARRRRLSSPRRTAQGPMGTTPRRFSGQERATCARRGGSCATHVGRRSLARTAGLLRSPPRTAVSVPPPRKREPRPAAATATCDRYQSSSGRLAVLLYNTTRSSRGCLPQRPLVAEPFLLCVLPGLVQSCRNRGAIHGREHSQTTKVRVRGARGPRRDCPALGRRRLPVGPAHSRELTTGQAGPAGMATLEPMASAKEIEAEMLTTRRDARATVSRSILSAEPLRVAFRQPSPCGELALYAPPPLRNHAPRTVHPLMLQCPFCFAVSCARLQSARRPGRARDAQGVFGRHESQARSPTQLRDARLQNQRVPS